MSERKHEPLLELDGKPIRGLKRCKACLLSETYWKRFPVCESKSVAKRLECQVVEPKWICPNLDHLCNLRGYCVNQNCSRYREPHPQENE